MKRLSQLAARLLAELRARAAFPAGERIAVAVSGGADSVALLRLLLELRGELGVVLSVAHFDHRIRGRASQADARFVAALAAGSGLQLFSASGDARQHARGRKLTLEAAARELRYRFLRSLVSEGHADTIATAHTLDDQAETVLMRLLRGAGTRGMAGILPRLNLAPPGATPAWVLRPLLGFRRREIEAYLRSRRQSWREDRSNRDLAHTRNRIRRRLLPRLEREFNPRVARRLAETAELARAEEEYWSAQAAELLPQIFSGASGTLNPERLRALPLALARRVLAAAAEQALGTLDFAHVEALRQLAQQAATLKPKRLALAGGQALLRRGAHGQELLLLAGSGKSAARQGTPPPSAKAPAETAPDYAYALSIPGETAIPEVGIVLSARLVTSAPENCASGVAQAGLRFTPGQALTVRNWRAGERYWPAHTRAPKKIKELLQKIPVGRRRLWPVIACGGEILWLRGFPPPAAEARSAWRREQQQLLIEEILPQKAEV